MYEKIYATPPVAERSLNNFPQTTSIRDTPPQKVCVFFTKSSISIILYQRIVLFFCKKIGLFLCLPHIFTPTSNQSPCDQKPLPKLIIKLSNLPRQSFLCSLMIS
uniref:Ovule protein n=1 Tax=Brugia timori TaxID=42155 RepID=A0A0R3QGF1_9BILA